MISAEAQTNLFLLLYAVTVVARIGEPTSPFHVCNICPVAAEPSSCHANVKQMKRLTKSMPALLSVLPVARASCALRVHI